MVFSVSAWVCLDCTFYDHTLCSISQWLFWNSATLKAPSRPLPSISPTLPIINAAYFPGELRIWSSLHESIKVQWWPWSTMACDNNAADTMPGDQVRKYYSHASARHWFSILTILGRNKFQTWPIPVCNKRSQRKRNGTLFYRFHFGDATSMLMMLIKLWWRPTLWPARCQPSSWTEKQVYLASGNHIESASSKWKLLPFKSISGFISNLNILCTVREYLWL